MKRLEETMRALSREELEQMLLNDFPESIIFRVTVSPFTQRRVIIIAGGLRTISSSRIGTIHVPEICSSVEHIHTNGYALSQHPIELLGRAFIVDCRMALSPHIEPGRIKFRHKIRTARMIFIDDLKDIFAEHSVQCRQCTVDVSGLNLPATVASK